MFKIAVYNRNDFYIFAKTFYARNEHTNSADVQHNLNACLTCLVKRFYYFLMGKAVHFCHNKSRMFRVAPVNFALNHCKKPRF